MDKARDAAAMLSFDRNDIAVTAQCDQLFLQRFSLAAHDALQALFDIDLGLADAPPQARQLAASRIVQLLFPGDAFIESSFQRTLGAQLCNQAIHDPLTRPVLRQSQTDLVDGVEKGCEAQKFVNRQHRAAASPMNRWPDFTDAAQRQDTFFQN